MKLNWALSEGKLTDLGTLALGALGASLIAYTLLISESFWLGSLSFIMGICCLGFAAIANNAASLGLRPFGEDFFSWRSAKETYRKIDSEGVDAHLAVTSVQGQQSAVPPAKQGFDSALSSLVIQTVSPDGLPLSISWPGARLESNDGLVEVDWTFAEEPRFGSLLYAVRVNGRALPHSYHEHGHCWSPRGLYLSFVCFQWKSGNQPHTETPLVRACVYSIEREAQYYFAASTCAERFVFPNISLVREGTERVVTLYSFTDSEVWEPIPEPVSPMRRPLS
jgi:hypothetical protein